MNRNDCLNAATEALTERGSAYGNAEDNFERIALMWSAILRRPISRQEVALCMIALKVARLIETPDHDDSWIDVAGYAALGSEVGECSK